MARTASMSVVTRNVPIVPTAEKRVAVGIPHIAGLVLVTLLAYWPAFHGGFIFDDNVFLTDNPLIHAGDGLRAFWFSREAADYWPVTSTTLWIEWRLWGMNAAGYHATNVALHLAGVLLLWAVLRRLRLPGPGVAALLFAVHPLNAESVTWITERKNLLATLFYLLAIHGFVSAKRWEYGFGVVAFGLAMLSKGSTVVLPLVLLGIVCWTRRPTARDGWRLLPFFLIAGGLALVESGFSTVTGLADVPALGVVPRLLRAAAVVWFYAAKAIWPANLCFDYGPWDIRAGDPLDWLPLGGLIAVGAVLWHFRRTWSRPALFGLGYFCVALLPVMGFAEVGFMRYSPVSGHYAPLALLGICALAGVAWERLTSARRGRAFTLALGAAGVVVVAACGFAARKQAAIYADALTLYRDTVARNPGSWIAQTNLGALLSEAGENEEALVHLQHAVQLKPGWEEAHTDLGLVYYRMGDLAEAIRQYQLALAAKPESYHAHNDLGAALARSGRLSEAILHFQEALRIRPDYREAQVNLDRARRIEGEGGVAR